VAVAVYFGISAVALGMTHQPISPGGLVRSSLDLLKHHAAFTDWRNPLDSRWYSSPSPSRIADSGNRIAGPRKRRTN
jgi:hypothetical protein